HIELRYAIAVDVRTSERAAILVPPLALDDELAGPDASLQALARFLSTRLPRPWRVQAFDQHPLASALQGFAVERAAALAGRCGTSQRHGECGKYGPGNVHSANFAPH